MSEINVERGGSQTYFGWLSESGTTFTQTFVATGTAITNLTFPIDLDTSTSASLRILIAEVSGTNTVGTIIYTSDPITLDSIAGESLDYGGGPFRDVILSLNVPVTPGAQYVLIFDALTDGNGTDQIVLGWNMGDTYTGGTMGWWFSDPAEGLSLNNNSFGGDYAFTMTFADANVINGTEGDDRGDTALVGTSNADLINGFGGNDELIGLGGNDTLDAGDGHDFLRGGDGNDELYGGDGDDFLYGNAGDDLIDGGAGYDRAGFSSGATAGVTVDLNQQGTPQDTGQGMDTLVGIENVSGTRFSDTIIGDGGDNWLWGGSDGSGVTGDDTISGGGGNDLVEVGAGNHTLDGGADNDTLSLFGNGTDITPDGVTVSLALQGGAQDTEQGSMTLTGFENLSGSIYDDNLTGDGSANVLAGDAGDDSLVGGEGNDTLYGDGQITTDSHGLGLSGPIVTIADTGAAGNDTLEGGLGDDYLDGGAGSDTASYANALGAVFVNLGSGTAGGADGNDTLVSIENVIGSDYDDSLIGNSGDNTLYGEGGADLLLGRAGNDTVYGGAGDDVVRGDGGNDQLYGGDGGDNLRGGSGVDYFDGGSSSSDFTLTGGWGDRVSFFEVGATQGVVADLRTGIISNDGFGNVETMVGIESLGADTAFVDTFYGNDERNLLMANLGDYLYGFGGDDDFLTTSAAALVDGGDGVDTLSLGSYGGWLMPDADADGFAESAAATTNGWVVNLTTGYVEDGYGNTGSVTGIENVDGSENADVITGDAGANVLNGADGDDTLEGAAGDDTLDGGAGVDTASYVNALGAVFVNLGSGTAGGADGNDTLVSIENVIGSNYDDSLIGNSGANTLSGEGGNDTVLGLGGDDTLYGGDGHDDVRGSAGNDFIYGDAGDDLLYGNAGDDYLDGGDGYDRVGYFSGATAGVTVDLNLQGIAQNTGQGWDTLVNIENVSGTQFGDTLIGDGNDNVLWGSASTISPGNVATTNNDTLSGGGGNDLLIVGIGNHVVDGGDGIDTFRFTENGAPETGIVLSLALQGTAQASGNGSWTLTNIENLSGSTAGDILTGDGNANVLAGNAGDDTLIGGEGNDTLYGDGEITWDTHEFGRSGPITTIADTGAAGNDTLEGGLGDDHIDGGAGIDTASYVNALGGVIVELWAGYASGADGNDTLVGIENVTGSDYDDTLIGDGGANVLSGGAGNDIVVGLGGDDTLDAGDGHDFLRGGDGNDELYGGDGDDFLYGNAGDDLIDGGAGYDRAGFSSGATAGVTVDLNQQGTPQDTGQGMDTLVGIEHVSGTRFSDTIIGDGGDNWLWGGSDGSGVTGDDTISAGGGNDLVTVGAGNHTLDGGSGNDTLSLYGNASDISAAGVTFSLAMQGTAQNS